MKSIGYSLLVNALSLFVGDRIVNSVHHAELLDIAIAAILLGLLNTFVKPILKLLSLPINFLSFGLFNLVINGVLIYVIDAKVDIIDGGFFTALYMGIIVSICNAILQSLTKDN
ncbi:MAG: hypothetical protein RI894_2043 [Bacteroidota bacterium]|jgi:putative membrane protein